MAVVLVTACQSAGQFSVLAYAAPLYKFEFGANPEQISIMFAWFGCLALAGNLVLNRVVDSMGAAPAVTITLGMMIVAWSLSWWAQKVAHTRSAFGASPQVDDASGPA